VRELLTADEQDLLHSTRAFGWKLATVGRSFARALEVARRAGPYDAVWLYRTLLLGGPALIEALLARTGPPIVYDFDDAIWLTKTVDANRAFSFLKFSGKTAKICRQASAVVVGTEALAAYTRAFNADVTVVPSTVDVDLYTPAPPRQAGPLVLGYSGSPTTIEYLETIGPLLRRFAQTADIELRVMGAEFALPGVKVVTTPWSAARELEELRSYDIGLMPLDDDPWTRGKGGMKALLYMSVGVPVVASPVGAATDIIEDGRNGLLCRTEDEWLSALERLVGDSALRRRLGQAGRATVEARYSPRVQVPRIVEVLERAASRRAKR
jgi:glycosyltransferase involved in cell wall biosynthesis